MFFFFDDEHPYTAPTSETLGVYKVKSIDDYMKGKEQLKRLKQLYDEMGQRKEEIDEEAERVIDAIQEQEKQLDEFAAGLNMFDSKYLSGNLEYLLKQKRMKVSDLESLLNVSAGYISRTIGVDSKKRISIDIVWMIAALFSVNIDDLLNKNLTAPTKDLKKVMSFLQKLKADTDGEGIHWNSLGNKPSRENEFFFTTNNDGTVVFSPNGETDDFYEVKGIYLVRLNIGPIFLVELETVFNEVSYRIYYYNEEDYAASAGSEYEIFPLSLMVDSMKDTSGMLTSECGKLRNTIKQHEKDFVISREAKDLMEQYLNPGMMNIPDDEEMPFK